YFLLASCCKDVKSNSKGGCSLVSLASTFTTFASVPMASFAIAASAASFLSILLDVALNLMLSFSKPACILKKACGLKFLFSMYREQIIANVGVCTRPKDKSPLFPAANVKACVAFIPINQSDSALDLADM